MKRYTIKTLKDLRKEKEKLALELGFHEEATMQSVGSLASALKSKILKGLMIVGATWIAKNHVLPKVKEIGAQMQISETPNDVMQIISDLARKYLKI